jgi:hypothetical protein
MVQLNHCGRSHRFVSKTRRRVSRARRLTAGYSHSALLSDIAHAAFWISDRACSSRIQRQQRRERRQQNQINNFHGRCPQLDGRWVVQHKPVTELLDAEKVLKAVEFCAPPRVPRQMIISGNSRGLALMHAGCQIYLSRPESPARNQLAYFPARLCRNLGKRRSNPVARPSLRPRTRLPAKLAMLEGQCADDRISSARRQRDSIVKLNASAAA